MSSSGSILAHPSSGGTALGERERLRALLLERRPALAGRLVAGPSGALVIPLAGGAGIEIGRMRRRGAPRWVVVAPDGDGARVCEPPTLSAVAREALRALDRAETGRPLRAVR
ncbi:hypothetical protein [Brachybacterium saurashtrense]|uniref:Uncharacterized protein n=1 Tax=Brachybacterium saurashtrense TaxID=556288 RepID=A0A345YLD4_9MICO|nr:hypothetical protein [Brachybacterium saurashtrense]AXK44736.1 hypothetical protein DWV08_03230 [Brachybacterium saurashtrense]RRR23348.1 hypothetical protein DXU92_08360 [Brachybacterium saurashtrense]